MWYTKNINIESCWFDLDIQSSCDASQFSWQEKLDFLQHLCPNNTMILHHGEGRGQKQTNQAVGIFHGKCFTKIWSYFHLSYFTNHFPGDTLTARHAHHTSLPGQYCNIQYFWITSAIMLYLILFISGQYYNALHYLWIDTAIQVSPALSNTFTLYLTMLISGEYAVLVPAFWSKISACIVQTSAFCLSENQSSEKRLVLQCKPPL